MVLKAYRLLKIVELPGAVAPGPHHFAKILDGDMKADHRLLEWMAKASPQTPNLKK